MEVKVFLFHRVHPERDPLWDPMDPILFDKCIRYISGNYRVCLLEDLLQSPEPFQEGKKNAAIVFDDGFKDNIDYALPVLEKYNVKASFYIVTGCIDQNIPTWTYILDYSFANTLEQQLELKYPEIPQELQFASFKTKDERLHFARKLKPVLKKLEHATRSKVLDQIAKTFADAALPPMMMNWKDLSDLKNKGHYIGSHTVNHNMLGTMSSEDEILSELIDSGNRIQEKLGYFPLTISYPVGSYNQQTIDLSRVAGYSYGLAVNQLTYDTNKYHAYEIPRIELYNEPWLKTRMRISGLYGTLTRILKRS